MLNRTFETMGTVVSASYGNGVSPEEAADATSKLFKIFDRYDREFSTYREDSFISQVNAGSTEPLDITHEAMEILDLAEHYRELTEGYFDIINPHGLTDPSGIVKAYAIQRGGEYLASIGFKEWCINAGGDILSSDTERGFTAGIINPFDRAELVSHVGLRAPFVSLATSGFSERGDHIWTPKGSAPSDIIQASVVSDDIIFSDVMATALVSAGSSALHLVESRENAEALLITRDGDFRVTEGYLALVAR